MIPITNAIAFACATMALMAWFVVLGITIMTNDDQRYRAGLTLLVNGGILVGALVFGGLALKGYP